MKNFALVLASICLTGLSWGVYGPVLKWGGDAMEGSHLRPFICVGLAYVVIAVLVPALMLKAKAEAGGWSFSGTVWSLVAGAAGALGALGIIMAFVFKGLPIYVMPLVFGGAPVVNTCVTMWMGRSFRQVGSVFLAGVILVALGAVTVYVTRPKPPAKEAESLTLGEQAAVAACVVLTVLCWGVYGPLLHKGQAAMGGSRLRPFVCVGLAYLAIAVVVPFFILAVHDDGTSFTFKGALWSLAAGAAGAIGALGLILAFNFGGKPIFVMPLVFGAAPVVNTFTTILTASNLGAVSPLFYAGLIVVVGGAATVLIFSPKAPRPAPGGHGAEPAR